MTGPSRPASSADLQLKVGVDRTAYTVGDPVALRASYRNTGSESFALVVSGTNLLQGADHPLPTQMANAPLYSMERLVLTADLHSGTRARTELRPIWSNMFFIHRLIVLQPGGLYEEGALLTSSFWEPADPSANALLPPDLPPGRYRLEALYTANPPSSADVDKMRRFQSGDDLDRSVDAFFKLGVMGVSYNDMQIYRTCDFRAWSGTIRTEDCGFTVE